MHSRPTEVPSGAQVVLQAALEQLRLEGAIFFRSELTEPFAFESSPAALAYALHPGAQLHIVARGSAWVEGTYGDRLWAQEGDVIVLPYGDHHTIGGGGHRRTSPDRQPARPSAVDEPSADPP